MNRIITQFFLLSLLLFLFNACDSAREENRQPDAQTLRHNLLGANAILIDAEKQEIDDFIDRHGWEMQSTGSGLRYMVYREGDGPRARKDDVVVFHYTLRLITGDVIYSSPEPSEFRIGHGGVESGLDEGMLLLRVGDKARLILPSHLAHGVPGDGARIPQRATLFYDVEVLKIK